MNRNRVASFVFLAVWLGAAVASAQVLYTTQEDFMPATAVDPGIVVGPPGAAGDTDGSTTNGIGNTTSPGAAGTAGALYWRQDELGYKQLNLGDENTNAAFLSALKGNTTLALDYTLSQDLTTGDNGYFQILGVFNFDGNYLGFDNNAFFGGDNLLAGPHTVVYDYSQHQAALPTGPSGALTYFQMFLVANSGGSLDPATGIELYIDNIRVIPEPISLALIGLAAPALWLGLCRRKRK
jgi:hypothetical protein